MTHKTHKDIQPTYHRPTMINIRQQTTNHDKKNVRWLIGEFHAKKKTNNNMYRPIENNHLFHCVVRLMQYRLA